MKTIITFFSGKKSYLVGLLMIALGYTTGDNQIILEGLAVISIRAGIKKAE